MQARILPAVSVASDLSRLPGIDRVTPKHAVFMLHSDHDAQAVLRMGMATTQVSAS